MVVRVREIIELLKGETAVIYGQPMVGKTLSTAVIAKILHDETGKPAFFIWSDANLLGSYGKFLEKLSGAVTKYVDKPTILHSVVRSIKGEMEREEKYSMVVVDSITGFQEEIMAKEGIDSPRTGLLLGRLSQMIARELREMSAKHGIPTIMIAHQTSIFKPDSPSLGTFAGKTRKPTIVQRALRNVTLLIYMTIDPKSNKPIWEIEDIRSSEDKVSKYPKGTQLTLELKVR